MVPECVQQPAEFIRTAFITDAKTLVSRSVLAVSNKRQGGAQISFVVALVDASPDEIGRIVSHVVIQLIVAFNPFQPLEIQGPKSDCSASPNAKSPIGAIPCWWTE